MACPLNKFKSCRREKCDWYVTLRGKDPQSQKEVDGGKCAIAWLPILLVENSQFERQTGAAVESMRNRLSTPIEATMAVLKQAVIKQQKRLEKDG